MMRKRKNDDNKKTERAQIGTSRDAISGLCPLREGRANLLPREGKAEKEAMSTPGPTFIATLPTTTNEKKNQPPERRANSPSREGRANPHTKKT